MCTLFGWLSTKENISLGKKQAKIKRVLKPMRTFSEFNCSFYNFERLEAEMPLNV